MKKSKTLTIRFEHWDDFKDRMRDTLKAGRKSIVPRDKLTFPSVAAYQKFMTEQKLSILAAIIRHQPASIYQLAQLVERDFANVQRDCAALENMGFMKLEESRDARKTRIPKLAFDYTRIVVQMPRLSYCHELRQAA